MGNGTLKISGDLTNKKREYRSSVINELKQQKENGEENLYIEYIKGVPNIEESQANKE